jgi:hypothetical protein
MNGISTLIKHDGNTWGFSGNLFRSDSAAACGGDANGSKTLSGTITTLRFTTTAGTAVFESGSISVKVE